ncbi:signal-transducing adaptor protein 1-like isoform X2 [Narcine bancroftii]|uniref:signal-transducing adaptor protein 1-like isoform X2 n=1 Tax=Narcine bancroftii TaxID=1343680 RepID=UPI00383155D2
MATSRTNLRVFQRREMITSLPLYYDGFLWKKRTRDKDFQRYWSELRGSSIFFYSDDKDITAENIETQEEWKVYITVVSTLEIPRTLSLLPGQVLRLKEMVAQEKERLSTAPRKQESQSFTVEKPDPEVYDDLLNTMPECFYKVSRHEAEAMLERYPEKGSLIIRPSTENSNYSITTMVTQNNKGIIKHYKVMNDDSGFVIGLENPVTYSTLQEVVDHFIKVTNGMMKPYVDSKEYANKIEMFKGQCTNVQKKPVPISKVAPIQRSSVLPSKYPDVLAMKQKPCNTQQKLPLKEQPLKPAACGSRGPLKEGSEPNYMNNEILTKLNQMNLADDRPPNYTAPKPLSYTVQNFSTGEDPRSELAAKLMKQRKKLDYC